MCDVRSIYICRECGGVVIACSWVHACMYTCGDPISASGVFCHVSPPHALRQSLLQCLALMNLAGLVGLSPGGCLSQTSFEYWGCNHTSNYMDDKYLNSSPHACMVNTLQTELAHQPRCVFCFFIFVIFCNLTET